MIAVRLWRALTVLFAASLLSFLIGHWSGDPVELIVRGDATQEQKQALRHDLGLDRPLLIQYQSYVLGALHGDFGLSYRQRLPVAGLILQRLPASLTLAACAFVVAVLAGIALGALAAMHPYRWPDRLVTAVSVLVQVLPGFWLGLVMVLVFAVTLHWLPVSGLGGVDHFVLPVVTLALPTVGRLSRLMRSGLLAAMRSGYARAARARGLSEGAILLAHGARNALLPVLAQAGLELGDMVGSAFIVESVFAWPGLGRLAVNAVLQRDFLVVQGCVLVMASGFVLINLMVDLLVRKVDPRTVS